MDNISSIEDIIQFYSKNGHLKNVYVFGSAAVINSEESVPPKDLDLLLIRKKAYDLR